MADKLSEVMKKLQNLEKGAIEGEKPEEKPVEEPKEEEKQEEEAEEEEEDDEEEEEAEEVKPEVKPIANDPSKEEVVASEVAILQNDGVFRRELMMVLHDIAGSLHKITSLVPNKDK